MVINRSPEIEQCRSLEEKEFALAILARADKGDWYVDLWFFEDPLVISVDLHADEGGRLVIRRTLRADFYGSRVVVGNDSTYQLVHLLDSTSADANFESDSPIELAQYVANWLENEMAKSDLRPLKFSGL